MGDRVRIIAEVKKASPSKGILLHNFDPVTLATTYADNGAAAISVLTDSHFQGNMRHLTKIKQATKSNRTPILRKDFIFDPYQVYETRASGADALLLIVSILSKTQLKELYSLCQELWIQALVEIHDENELEVALDANVEIIGINNRDLHTFETDLSITEHLAALIPKGKLIVSESGISGLADVNRLRIFNVNAVLVGEALVTAPDIGAKVRELSFGTPTTTESND